MRRFALLLPLWLVVLVAEPGFVHACPAHEAQGAEVVAGAHAHHGDAAGEQDSRESDSTACTCVGTCCVATAPSLFQAETANVAGTSVFVEAAADAPVARVIERDTQRRLPFPNGPPEQPTIARG